MSEQVKRGLAVWDERRNSSRVFPVPPSALPDALRALQSVDAPLRQWIEDGAPNLTDAEHVARFGEPYIARKSRRVAG